jgi:hypothetical protein
MSAGHPPGIPCALHKVLHNGILQPLMHVATCIKSAKCWHIVYHNAPQNAPHDATNILKKSLKKKL